MILNQRNKYMETTIQTATPAQLLIMLYDGAIRFSKMSIESIKAGRFQEANENLIKVQNIISELIITLDKTSSVAVHLVRLYEYFKSRLIEANMKKDVSPVEEVLGYLVELKETWMQAARQINGANSTMATGAKHG